jgi:hypothetical protein
MASHATLQPCLQLQQHLGLVWGGAHHHSTPWAHPRDLEAETWLADGVAAALYMAHCPEDCRTGLLRTGGQLKEAMRMLCAAPAWMCDAPAVHAAAAADVC